MRTEQTGLTDVLFPRVRLKVLGLLLADPDQRRHLREIARRGGLAPATVQREVTALAKAGILLREREGHQVYYRANRQCPIFPELRGIALKTLGLADVLRDMLAPFREQIELAFLFGSAATGTMDSGSDVDLLVVGQAGLFELTPALQQAEARLGREVNALTMRPDEFAERVATGEHFLTTVLGRPLIFLIGDEDELGRLSRRRTTAAA